MKRVVLAISLIVFGTSMVFAGNDLPTKKDKSNASKETKAVVAAVTGNVTDSQTNESLAGVAIEIEGTNMVVYTDFDGNFVISDLEPGYYNIVVRFVSYQGHLIERVYIQQGQNTIPAIKLMAN
jgi:hypothetical protein